MPELVGKVEEDEKIELMELVEKKSALENLKLLDLNKEKSEKVEKELQNIQFLIQNWWNNKSEKPDNYFVGLILSRGKNIEHVQEFLQERDFLSVVITGGILPDSLRTDTYIMRITDGTMEALRNPQILKMLCEIGDRCTNEIDYLSKKIDETSLKICSMNILEEQRNLYFGFILCVNCAPCQGHFELV